MRSWKPQSNRSVEEKWNGAKRYEAEEKCEATAARKRRGGWRERKESWQKKKKKSYLKAVGWLAYRRKYGLKMTCDRGSLILASAGRLAAISAVSSSAACHTCWLTCSLSLPFWPKSSSFCIHLCSDTANVSSVLKVTDDSGSPLCESAWWLCAEEKWLKYTSQYRK